MSACERGGPLPSIDALRFIASAAIVFLHAAPFFYPEDARSAAAHSALGLAFFVDLFFVLSGFVIAWIYAEQISKTGAYAGFMLRRFARLIPLHVLTVAAVVVAAAAARIIGVGINNPIDLSAGCVLGTLALLHSVGVCEGNAPNPQSWSIGAEMAMYLAFPLLLAIRHKALVAAVCFVAALQLAPTVDQWTHLPGPVRALPGFLAGLALYDHRKDMVMRQSTIMLVVALTALFAVAFARPHPALILVAVVAVAVSAVAADMRGGSRIARTIAPLGKYAYSVYLIHWLPLAAIVGGGSRLLGTNAAGTAALVAIALGFTAGLSWLSHHHFEGPARRFILDARSGRTLRPATEPSYSRP